MHPKFCTKKDASLIAACLAMIDYSELACSAWATHAEQEYIKDTEMHLYNQARRP